MNNVTFLPNPALKFEWEHAPETWAMMAGVGEEIVTLAKGNAPVLTGALRDSIHAEAAPSPGAAAGVDVVASVEYAGFVELGTSDTPAQAFLRPALDEAVG